MPTLFFPEQNLLRQVLTSGGISASITSVPANVGHDAQDRLWLRTTAWLAKDALVTLTRYGVQILGDGNVALDRVISCWWELLALEPVALSPEHCAGSVIFELSSAEFASFAREIERLSPHPYCFSWRGDIEHDARVLLQTVAPPYFTFLRAVEAPHEQGIITYVEQAPGVWIEAGYRHPMAEQIQLPLKKALFIRPPRGWEFREPISFEPTRSEAPTTSPAPGERSGNQNGEEKEPIASIPIRLRLLPSVGSDESAEMWIVDLDAIDWLHQFVQNSDERMLMRFEFAISDKGGKPTVSLRLRPGKDSPAIVGSPRGYRRIMKLSNLFLPCGYHLAPNVRRDTLRQLFSHDHHQVTWLAPLRDGAFQTLSLPASSFRPVSEWIEHALESEPLEHVAWDPAQHFGFERFAIKVDARARSENAQVNPKKPDPIVKNLNQPVTTEKGMKRGLIRRALNWLNDLTQTKAHEPAPELEEAAPIPMEEAVNTALNLPPQRDLQLRISEAQERVKAVEGRFIASLASQTPADRLELLPELGSAYVKSNNHAEASVCWLNALWQQDKLSPLWAWGWLRAEATLAQWDPQHIRIAEWLAAPPQAARSRAVAAYVVWASRQEAHPAGFLANLGGIQAYLDKNENDLPIRAAWLARTALAKLTRGDVLALAQTRDRLFERLHQNGLSLDMDTPAFIRIAESGDPDRFKLVRKWLTEKRHLIHKWVSLHGPEQSAKEVEGVSLQPYGLQAEIPRTRAYSDLMLSWGLARLGEKTQGAHLRDQAWQLLDENDPIHACLKSAFDYRIRQARDGMVCAGPLPVDLSRRIDALPAEQRYRIDRLRQHSKILDPSERIDAYWSSTFKQFRGWSGLRKKLIELPGLDAAALNERVRDLLDGSIDEKTAELPAVLFDILDMAPRLEGALGERVLQLVPAALDLVDESSPLHLRLLEKGLLAAAFFDRPTTVQLLAHRFAHFVEEKRGVANPALLEGITGQTFRCLRRLGLKNEADRVLFQIAGWLTRGEDIAQLRKSRAADWPGLLRTLLHVAAGWYYCGREKEGYQIIEEVRKDLYGGMLPQAERTALALTYAKTLGHVPVRFALGRFDELFLRLKKISVNGWNTHYTLQPLKLIDTVILAIVSDEFTLGPTIRGWLDDEEYLVRQRIHQELKEQMLEQGV